MRFLLAGVLATLTAAGLAAIRPPVLTDEERAAALAIRETRMRADVRFLSSDLLEGRGPAAHGDRLARAYLASRFEAIGLESGGPGVSWLLQGRDPEVSREAVVYIGTLDNASSLAALLAIAEAYAALPERPRRSIRFAAVAAEGRGLPGSNDPARHPQVPAGRVAAVFSLDGTSIPERTHDACCRFDFTPDGDLRGAVEDARLLFHVGAKVADTDIGR